jgi:hypothetical protein
MNEPTEPDLPVAKPVPSPPPADPDPGFEYADEEDDDFVFAARPYRPRKMQRYVRVILALMAVGFTAVLIIAACLRPYDADGNPYSMGTHQQLGLQPCNMVVLTGKPCPACGMTTSFALLVHGDVANSLKANWVGTLFCVGIAVLTPWAAASAYRGRLLWVRNGEMFATILLTTLLVLMMGRWLVIWVT